MFQTMRNMVRSRLSSALFLVSASVIGLSAGGLMSAETAEAGHTACCGNLQKLYIGTDGFWNYDFVSQSAVNGNVDWPVTIVFGDDAEVDKVKDIYPWGWGGGAMYLETKDGSSWTWDSDSGIKTVWCPSFGVTAQHMRVYADSSDDRNYTTAWGFYVLATTHQDRNECALGAKFGWSEQAEEYYVNEAASRGYSTSHDWGDMYNYEPPRWEGTTVYWNNSGKASWVTVP